MCVYIYIFHRALSAGLVHVLFPHVLLMVPENLAKPPAIYETPVNGIEKVPINQLVLDYLAEIVSFSQVGEISWNL